MAAPVTRDPRLPPLPSTRRRLWAQRLSLSALSFLVTALLLEALVRRLGVPGAPVLLREGLYASQLPMVTGRDNAPYVAGSPLPETKRRGEIRVFVFGESSVEGLPWGYGGSPPAMLRDHLRALSPQADFTVVNMGRSASTMMDAYYYLVSIEAYAPDVVVFYQGSNDLFHTDRERCAPALHPRAYSAYRWLVERSRLLWAARALGPRVYTRIFPPTSRPPPHAFGEDRQPGDLCDPAQAFPAWTEILLSTAKGLGARIIVTTPVENPLRWADENTRSQPAPSEPYRRLLSCALGDDCDLVATWKAVRGAPSFAWDRLGPRRRAWIAAAEAHGARVVDFAGYLEREAEGGLRPPLFAEEVHLSLEGYWRLSWLWATEIRALVEDRPSAGLAAPPPPLLDERFYLSEAARYGSRGSAACTLLRSGALHLRLNMRVLAASLLESAVNIDAPPAGEAASSRVGAAAQLLLAWLRRDAGVDPRLPSSLAAALDGLDVARLTEELQRHADCSSLPGAPPGPGAAASAGSSP